MQFVIFIVFLEGAILFNVYSLQLTLCKGNVCVLRNYSICYKQTPLQKNTIYPFSKIWGKIEKLYYYIFIIGKGFFELGSDKCKMRT